MHVGHRSLNRNNKAFGGGAIDVYGAGIIESSDFVDNIATNKTGGAISGSGERQPLVVKDSQFIGNQAWNMGLFMYHNVCKSL